MSEPQHIREILPDVMQDIARRMELNRQKKALSAVGDYLSGKKCRDRKQRVGQPSREDAARAKLGRTFSG